MEKLTEKEKMNTAEVIAELVALKEFFDELTNATPVCIEYAIDELKRLEVEAIPINWLEDFRDHLDILSERMLMSAIDLIIEAYRSERKEE